MPRSFRQRPVPLRVRAHGLDRSGAGLATHQPPSGAALQLLVAGLLPGESADVDVQHQSPHTARAYADMRRRHDAAPERVVPACARYGVCGGCALQHLQYEQQLQWKRRWLAETLAQAGIAPDEPIPPCVPTPGAGLGYRTRSKLVAAAGGMGAVILGAYAPRSHEVVDLRGCQVARPLLAAVAETVAELAARLRLAPYDERERAGALRYVLLREAQDRGEATVAVSLVVAQELPAAVLDDLVRGLREAHPEVAVVVAHHNAAPGNALLPPVEPGGVADQVLWGPPDGAVWDQVGAVRLRVSPRSFSQVNRDVAAAIYQDTAAGLGAIAGERLLDLYCGVGGIGLTVAAATAAVSAGGVDVLGIEASAEAVADAAASAAAAGLSGRAGFRVGEVAQVLTELRGARFDLVAMNPPRKGCGPEVIAGLLALGPRAVAYVSCEPESLARDLCELRRHGYRVVRVTPYDMHPHTGHIETLSLLQRG